MSTLSTHVRRTAVRFLAAAALAATPGIAFAQGLGGFNEVQGGTVSPRQVILNILYEVLSYGGLIATVVIVIAGIYLLTSGGEEAGKDKAKKIILYAILGIIVIGTATIIVRFVMNAVS